MFANSRARWLTLAGLLAVVIGGLAWVWSSNNRPQAASMPGPRLAVLLVFDQLRGDYPQRWRELYPPGGFRRLQEDGAWFSNCNYPYAHTVTAAGHASLLTGCSPDKHGIVGNEWYDRAEGQSVTSVSSQRYEQVPPPPPDKDGRPRSRGVSPDRLLAPTVGETLKAVTNGKAKVVGLSLKDRGAVLPTGRKADLCFWMETDTSYMVSSEAYTDRLPSWAAGFNAAKPANRWFGQDWRRFRPDLDYVRYSGADDQPGEGTGFKQGRTFPHPMTGGLTVPGRDFYLAIYNSPMGNDLLLEFAKRAIVGERLGKHDVPDLLTISFSSNDAVGHTWGPDSQEVLDVTLRTDAIIRDLLTFLDEQVGRGQYVLVLSADHGVCPLAEVSIAQGRDAGRVNFKQLAVAAEEFLNEHYRPTPRWFEDMGHSPWFYLNRGVLQQYKLDQAAVEKTLARWLETQPGVARAFTRTEMSGPCPNPEDQRFWKAFHQQRCGDVTVTTKPYWSIMMPFAGGTNHGSPHPYDTHVPLMAYGPGIAGGQRTEAVTPQAAAAILANRLNIAPPAAAEAPLPATLLAP